MIELEILFKYIKKRVSLKNETLFFSTTDLQNLFIEQEIFLATVFLSSTINCEYSRHAGNLIEDPV